MARQDTRYGGGYRSGYGYRSGRDHGENSSSYSHGDGSAYAGSGYGDRHRDYEPHYPYRGGYGRDGDRDYGDIRERGTGDWRGYGRDYEADRGELRHWDRDEGWGRSNGRTDRSRNREIARTRGGEYPEGDDRNWWDRTRDEVSSWFGGDDSDGGRTSNRGRGPKGYTRSDERIREDVSDRLTDDHVVDASDIEVQVKDGEVTLSGTVDSRRAKRRAEDCAEDVSGVKNVQNNLRVSDESQKNSSGTRAAGSAAAGGSDASRERATAHTS